jgi:hypothetical protein
MRSVSISAIAFLSVGAAAQYTAVVLPNHPGHLWSVARGAGLRTTAGYSVPNGSTGVGDERAILWIRSQPVDVTPSQYFSARVLNSRGDFHVGNVSASQFAAPRAYLWNSQGAGTLLHPAEYTSSLATGVGGGKQVGQVVLSSMCFECGYFVERHGVVWSGTAQSMVRLHAPGFSEGRPVDTDGTTHVGTAYQAQSGQYRAVAWQNSSSPIDLHPQGFTDSHAFGVEGFSQVGFGETGTSIHALLWRGSAGSVVDLHPAGYELSVAYSVAGKIQVGSGRTVQPGPDRALAWRGTAASVVDLHQLLPAGFRLYNSIAEDVDYDGVIAGTCVEDATGLTRSVVWIPSNGQRR